MKKLMLSSLIVFSGLFAQAEEYPVLATYKTLAEQLMEASTKAQTQEEWTQIATGARELVTMGVEIMNLYASKNPNCTEQFNVMISELPGMEAMDLDAADERYHDGKGLPTAPRHCYYGRSQVIHPVLTLIRLKGEMTEKTREKITHEFEEVAEHIRRIRKNLDNPPN